jgi:hypothetical protein
MGQFYLFVGAHRLANQVVQVANFVKVHQKLKEVDTFEFQFLLAA